MCVTSSVEMLDSYVSAEGTRNTPSHRSRDVHDGYTNHRKDFFERDQSQHKQ